MAINSGHPVALSMTVSACVFSILPFPGIDVEFYVVYVLGVSARAEGA